jgi:hypothetical protein
MAESAPSGRLAARFDGLDSFMQRRAHAFELCRQFEDRYELLVPADELQVLVEDRDTLLHMVDGRLQKIAIILDGR